MTSPTDLIVEAGARIDWVQQGTFSDANGERVNAYDDVVLLAPVAQRAPGNVSVDPIPQGSQATVLFFTTAEPVLLDLECYPQPSGFSFAFALASEVVLAVRGDEKRLGRTLN